MKAFKSSLLSEKVTDYVHPSDAGGHSASSDESESGLTSPENSDDDFDESESEGEKSDSTQELAKGNAGWADAMSKILKTNKPKKKKSVVLSRAKKLNAATDVTDKSKDVTFEIDGEIKEEKPDIVDLQKTSNLSKGLPKVKKKEWESRGRIKPTYPDPEREKNLSRISIKGIVQLFNAVHKHQKEIGNKLKDAGSSEIKREKVLKSVDKRAFLDVLMGNAKSEIVDSPNKKETKIQLKAEGPQAPLWSVLRDDFMTDANLKDWDKETEQEVQEVGIQESLSSDNDDVDMT